MCHPETSVDEDGDVDKKDEELGVVCKPEKTCYHHKAEEENKNR